MSIAALILGILSIIGSIVGAVNPIGNTITIIALVVGVIAIILAALGMKKGQGHGKAVAGLVCSIIAVVISVIMLIACSGTKSVINQGVNEIQNAVDQATGEVSQEDLESLVGDLADQLGVNVENAD